MKKKIIAFNFILLLTFVFGISTNVSLADKYESSETLQQEIEVNGTITDAQTGDPLPGVNIVVQGTTIGTTTDMDGNYTIEAPSDATLVFTFVGYQERTADVNGRNEINISMQQAVTELEEVVAVGYGTQKKENLTGAVDMASAERLESRPIRSVGEGMQGVIPNLNVTVTSGDPTDDPEFNIRGYESITGGDPLILIDGVPGDPNRLNPSDIQSVNVIKDASAAAVYGGRAAFGVVLIETKEGEAGDMEVTFDARYSAERPIWNMNTVTDPYRFVTHKNKAYIDRDGSPNWSDRFVQETKEWSENPTPENAWGVHEGVLEFYGANNYHDRVLRDFSPMQEYNLSLSGGSEESTYYASLGLMNTDGLFQYGNDNFKRYNVLVKTDQTITDWFSMSQKAQVNAEVSDKPYFYHWDVNLNTMARVSPIMPVEFPKVEYFEDDLPASLSDRDYSQYEGMYMSKTNWIPYLKNGGRDKFQNADLTLTQRVTITPIENLEFRGDFTYNLFTQREEEVASEITKMISRDLTRSHNELVGPDFSSPTSVDTENSRNHHYVINAVAEYELDNDGSPHYFKGMVGFNQEWYQNYWLGGEAYNMITPAVRDISATTGDQLVDGSKSHTALRGAFYRLNYIFDDRYLIEFNGRYDGTSKFPKDDRFGFFPSVSAGWRVSEEDFMAGFDFLSNLKLRGSYGTLGNQDVTDQWGNPIYYPYITSMGKGLSNYMMGGGRINSIWSPGLVSPTLTWETVVTQNAGIDIGLFDNKLTANFDTYIRSTKDMLMDVSYPDLLGTGAPDVNAADLETKGWEFQISYRDDIGQDWNYNVSFNISDYTTTITEYENPTGAIWEYYEGQEIGEIWGYETHSIFQNEQEVEQAPDQAKLGSNWKPGDIRYKDLNGDGEIGPGNNTLENPGDRKIIGNNTPSYSFGMNLDVTYKRFTVSVFFQGVGERDVWPPSGNWHWFFPYMAGHIEEYYITESWSEDNRDAYFYAPEIRSHKNTHEQTRYLQDASYIRLKDLRISYRVPQEALKSIGLNRLRLYLASKNLWEFSNIHKPLDPEYIFSNAVPYPLQRTYSAGIELSF
jgi:TonB-linked SusC/RagA family outer membrane protein